MNIVVSQCNTDATVVNMNMIKLGRVLVSACFILVKVIRRVMKAW